MPDRTAIVTASSLNVRTAPDVSSTRLTALPRDTVVEVKERVGGWYRIRHGAVEGFVSGDYLRLQLPAAGAGFLAARDDLRAVPLQPPHSETIQLGPHATRSERSVAATWNSFGGLLRPLSETIGIPTPAAVSVLCVESGGQGYVDGRMVIRFENHVFFDHWGKRNPARFAAHFTFDRARRWQGHKFRPGNSGPFAAFHGDQKAEWRVFDFARTLSEPAAMRSISMGAPQIMGFNHAMIGYDSVREMFDAFSSDVRFQILGLFDFIKGSGSSSRMVQALERGQFDQFATLYNGPGQAAIYGDRIRSHCEAVSGLLPSLA